VGRPAFETIWRHSVELLQRGFKTGSILTVDPEEAKALGPPWQRRCAISFVPPEPFIPPFSTIIISSTFLPS
jgi:hypothetical protein